MSGYWIALIVYTPIHLLCSLYNRRLMANAHGSTLMRYKKKYGPSGFRTYIKERRSFTLGGPACTGLWLFYRFKRVNLIGLPLALIRPCDV